MATFERARSLSRRMQTNIDLSSSIASRRNLQDYILVWLDAHIDEADNEYQNVITQFYCIVNTIYTFTDSDRCVDFLTEFRNEKVFVIVSCTLAERIVPVIDQLSQMDSIYVFCNHRTSHKQWTSRHLKVKNVYNDIDSICEALRQAVRQCDQNFIDISFMFTDEASNSNANQLNQSFMYSQLFKEVLLQIVYGPEAVRDFAHYCRTHFSDNPNELKRIARFEQEYKKHAAIWWYTYNCFLYPMLNRALRNVEADIILKMGFFISDLHRRIKQLYMEQSSGRQLESFEVYRGQGLSKDEFKKLCNMKAGLISFNNFLSTSKSREVALRFIGSALSDLDSVGILFVMTIDPTISSAPFALLDDVSYYHAAEREILFSTHTIFRIGDIKRMNENNRLWEVKLSLTTANDPQLSALIQKMREEIFEGPTGWYRLGQLLIKLGQFEEAEDVYNMLLKQRPDEDDEAAYYHQLGYIKNVQTHYKEAISFYEQSLQIREKKLSPNDPLLVTTYNNIAVVYGNMNEYSTALSFFEKIIEIYQQSDSQRNASLGTYFSNIGYVYESMGQDEDALSFYEKALEIDKNNLPSNHPNIATTYNNLGSVYDNMKDYVTALSFYEKSLEIRQQTLPPIHHLLGETYQNISSAHIHMKNYSQALTFYEKYLHIYQNTVPQNHSSLEPLYNHIAFLYEQNGDYTKACEFHHKAHDLLYKKHCQ